ncbi:protein RarD [Sphingomonas sp. IBVSS1]|uniref:Protein RarD n=1 Tax=Sandarakinorhabdus cyanobacteriorum TaxID=1981098 RepID=A0A255YEH9_9SPHN|nr:EamA family transporter RarD [Sandarakinorhabdus cyanobacteriorum]OSZ72757.1 protein RarD [Sphingomonas sp. IBVSS1]OYQ27084.1 protein RarD [Sandarakinorhabdus cyanobacteriorum]
MNAATPTMRDGLIAGLGAYVIWGLMPLYLRLMQGVPAGDVLGHRIAWSLLVLSLVLALSAGWQRLRPILANRRLLLLLLASALAIGVNWLVYTWAILAGHALDTSLGYFINPLLNVLFGVALLGERLSRLQWAAVALAAAGVAVQTIALGYLPWISLTLAVSFGLYGLFRKKAAVDGLSGLFVETLLLAPLALGWLATRPYSLTDLPGWQLAVLAASGVVTATPLLLFGRAARVLPLSTLGLLQYLSPTLVMIEAVTLFGETLSPARLAAFGCIWAGLALYTWSMRPVAQPAATR